MKRAIVRIVQISCAVWLAYGQSAEAPVKFEIADVHVSAKAPNQYFRTVPVRNGRYELKNATMVDLVRTAYDFTPDKILGGPNWLEMDRFDVVAKVPADTTPESLKLMLQTLLADRFKLVVHKENRDLPTYALTAKKPQLKEADGKEETGCKLQSSAGPAPQGDGPRLTVMFSSAAGGAPTTINMGPGGLIQYSCRNMSMAGLADALHTMLGANLGANPIPDQTGLKGNWNFDLKYSLQMNLPIPIAGEDRVSIFDALEKQLGLKLDQQQVATPVIVVDSVNQKPGANPPGIAEALPPIPNPTEFEVASVKPSDPGATIMGGLRTQAGGRVTGAGMPLSFYLNRAFSPANSSQVLGIPEWANSARFDLNAKAPSDSPTATVDNDTLAQMMRALLVERFGLKYHTEEQPMTAYTLVSVKPKLKKAAPDSRTSCKTANAPAGAPAGSQVLTCQNYTMAQFAERLQGMASELSFPVLDATGIEGGWDFSVTYSSVSVATRVAMARIGSAAAQPAGDMPSAADPVGGVTLFDAIEKQLGLKLEAHKRPVQAIVIDHLEQKPTEN